LPIALTQSGDNPRYRGQPLNSPNGGNLGDLRIGARVRLFDLRGSAFQLALGGYLWVPTGSEQDYLSDGKVRGAPLLIASGRAGRFLWSAQAGVEFRRDMTLYGAREGDSFRAGGGAGVILGKKERGQLGAELSGLFVLRDPSSRTSGLELLASAKWRVLDAFEVGAAAGPGLVGGTGTPSVRALLSLMYTPQQPNQAQKRSEPPRDRDADGIPDAEDNCPDQAGPAHTGGAPAGCPAPVAAPAPQDRDGDGVIDSEDPCPDQPGTATQSATRGCPVSDADSDGVPDASDVCPSEPGRADAVTPGCPEPKRALETAAPAPVAGPELLPERVQFSLGDSGVGADSAAIAKVAARMKQQPDKKLTIEGHSDDLGPLDYNTRLSEQRAQSAKSSLVHHGIAPSRIDTVGYGPTRPLVEGTSPQARARNRRVEFVLHD
jgi:outer membrane protein OmpA-like peptidoglycan-associated protein